MKTIPETVSGSPFASLNTNSQSDRLSTKPGRPVQAQDNVIEFPGLRDRVQIAKPTSGSGDVYIASVNDNTMQRLQIFRGDYVLYQNVPSTSIKPDDLCVIEISEDVWILRQVVARTKKSVSLRHVDSGIVDILPTTGVIIRGVIFAFQRNVGRFV